MPERKRLTKAIIDRIAPPARGRTFVYDAAVPHLTLCITPADARVWYVYRRIEGKPERVRLGAYPAMPIDAARREAERVNGGIASGLNPQAQKRAARGEMTFSALWALYLAKHAKIHKRPRSVEEDERNYKLHLSAWAGRRVVDIDAEAAQKLHVSIGKDAPITANRVLALLSKVYNFAISPKGLRLRGVENPARFVERFPEHSRERYVTPAEMPALLAAIRDEPNETARDFILTLLLTGARRRNVQTMRWSDVHLEWGDWAIPAAEAKGKKPLTLHLVPQAVELLKRRADSRNGSPYVFPGYGGSGHIEEPKSAWSRVCKRARIEGLRLHGLRHTFATWNAASGMQAPALMRAMGHRSLRTTTKYLHLDLTTLRGALNSTADAMLSSKSQKTRSRRKNLLPAGAQT